MIDFNNNKHITARHRNNILDRQEKAVDVLREAIASGDNEQILLMFLKESLCGQIPKGPYMLTWLRTHLHEEDLKRLIEAFMSMACLNCHNGLVECMECDGHGHTELDITCQPCLGLGVRLCDFCGGSGWAPIDYVPSELNALVYATRLATYEKSLKKQLNKYPINKTQRQPSLALLRDLSRELLYLNRYVCILETAAGVSKDMIQVSDRENQIIKSVLRSAPGLAKKAQEKLIGIVRDMFHTCNCLAGNDQLDDNHRKLVAAKAELYQSIIKTDPPFVDTFLGHPILYARGWWKK